MGGVEGRVNTKRRMRRMTPLERTRFIGGVVPEGAAFVGAVRAPAAEEEVLPVVLDDAALIAARGHARFRAGVYAMGEWLTLQGVPADVALVVPFFVEVVAVVVDLDPDRYEAAMEAFWDGYVYGGDRHPFAAALEEMEAQGVELVEDAGAPGADLVDVEVELYRLCGLLLNDEDGLTDDDVCAIYNRVEWAMEAYRLASGTKLVTFLTE